MRLFTFAILVVLAIHGTANAQPKLPSLCQHGPIYQDGNRVTILGAYWTAKGEFHGDKLHLRWTRIPDGVSYVAVYELDGQIWFGHFHHGGKHYQTYIWRERP